MWYLQRYEYNSSPSCDSRLGISMQTVAWCSSHPSSTFWGKKGEKNPQNIGKSANILPPLKILPPPKIGIIPIHSYQHQRLSLFPTSHYNSSPTFASTGWSWFLMKHEVFHMWTFSPLCCASNIQSLVWISLLLIFWEVQSRQSELVRVLFLSLFWHPAN